MTKVKMETELPVEPDEVWETIGRFNALQDWHPAVEESGLEAGGNISSPLPVCAIPRPSVCAPLPTAYQAGFDNLRKLFGG